MLSHYYRIMLQVFNLQEVHTAGLMSWWHSCPQAQKSALNLKGVWSEFITDCLARCSSAFFESF